MRMRNADGQVIEVDDAHIKYAEGLGYTPETDAQNFAALKAEASRPEDRGVIGTINAAATGLLSGATLGLSDMALSGLLDDDQRKRLAFERESHPIASGLGQVAGAIAPALAAPGSLLARTPAGVVSQAANRAFASGRAAGGITGTAQALGAAATEGAIQNAGMYLADTALGDRKLSAEGLFAALGAGGAFGAAGGAAVLGIEQGTIAARRMFSRAGGTGKAADDARAAWQEQYQSTIEASDAAADIARAKLAEAKAAREQAQLAKLRAKANQAEVKMRPAPAQDPAVTPPIGMAAPAAPSPALAPEMRDGLRNLGLTDEEIALMSPGQLAEATAFVQKADAEMAALGPKPLTPDAEIELAAAVAERDAARVELEDILRRLEAPDIGPGVAPSSSTVPVGEFGAPGMRGYDPGNVRAPGPPSVVEAQTADVTAVGKRKFAEGTPAESPVLDALVGRSLDQQYDDIMAQLKMLKRPEDVPLRRQLSAKADELMDQMMARDVDLGLSTAPTSPPALKTGPEPAVPGAKISDIKHPDETPENFVLRRMREQGTSFVPNKDTPKRFLGSLGIDWSVPENKALMLKMMRNGDATFARADLVGAMDPTMVKASEITDAFPGGKGGGPSWHFILDTGQPVKTLDDLAKTSAAPQKTGSVPSYDAIKAHEKQFDNYLEQTLPAREIAAMGYFEPPGGGVDPVRIANALDAIREGQREAITLGVTPTGKITVDSGRHRLAAAIELDKPIKVKWFSSSEPSKGMAKRAGPAGSGPAEHTAAMEDADYSAFAKRFADTLTDEERNAALAYSKASHAPINGTLRTKGVDGLSAANARTVEMLDAVIAKSELPSDMVVLRGIRDRDVAGRFRAMKPGEEFIDEGYTSTTAANRLTQEFSDPAIEMRIAVPRGAKAAPIPTAKETERELLLPRGQRFRVDSVVKDPDRDRLVMQISAIPTQPTSTATDTLTGQLRSMQSKLGAGEDLKTMGAPARAEYAAAKTAKTADAAEHFRGKAIEGQLPDGFSAGGLYGESSIDPKSIKRVLTGIPESGEQAARDALYVVRPSELANRGIVGTELHEKSKASVLKAWESGKRLDPVEAYVMPDGKLYVYDGNHRIQAAAATDRPIAVAFKNGAGAKVEAHAGDITERIRAELPRAKRGGVPTTPFDFEQGGVPRFDPKSRTYHDASAPWRQSEEFAPTEDATGMLARPAAPASAVEDIAQAAEVVTKYERANARLVEALGPEAPPAAQQAAKAFRESEEAAERKTMTRTTRAIDDQAEAQAKPAPKGRRRPSPAPAPAPPAPGSPDWLDDAKATGGKVRFTPEEIAARDVQFREWELNAAQGDVDRSDLALRRARVAEADATMGVRSADETAGAARRALGGAPTPTEAPASRLGAMLTTVGVAGELGVPGVPRPSDIPVIGPLLKLYFGYRALKATTGRFTGRIPATGDARAAALVAGTKDRISTAVDKTLGLVAEKAPKARAPVVAAATVLGHRAFDDGEPDAPKGASTQELAATRIREIATAATRPDLVAAHVRRELRGVIDPDLIEAAEQHLIARFQYLNSVMPKAPPPNPYSMRKWVPSPAAAHDVAQRLAVVHDPETAFQNPTPAKVDTAKNVYPQLLKMAQDRLIERIADARKPVKYENRLRSSFLYDLPLDDSLQPQHAAILATAHKPAQPVAPPAAPQGPMPSIAGETNLTSVYQTASDRRAMR